MESDSVVTPAERPASLNRAEAEAISVADLRDVLCSIGISIASEEALEQRCAVARPEFVTAFANGDYTVNAEPLYPDVSDEELLADAANAVSDTIIDVWLTSWPECTEHFGPPLSARVGGQANRPGEVHWYCSRGDHAVAPVGQLGSQVATVRGALPRNT